MLSDKNQKFTNAISEALNHKSFIYLTLGFFVCGWHIALVATHIPIYINDRGLPEWCTVTILSMIGLFNIAGTLTSGYLAQKFSKKLILSSNCLHRANINRYYFYNGTNDTTYSCNLFYYNGFIVACKCSTYIWFGRLYIWIAIHGHTLWHCIF